MNLSTILFDLGSTLIYSKRSWSPIFIAAEQALVRVLQEAGVSITTPDLQTVHGGFLDTYYAERGNSPIEQTTGAALRHLLANHGHAQTPEMVQRQALDALYAVTQENWYLEADAIPTLRALKQQGKQLGLISNTSDDRNVQQLLDLFCLRPFFDCLITSAATGIRKPDSRIFQYALDHFGIPPQAGMMVGDTLEADILGANQVGLYSVWITRRAAPPMDGELTIQPGAVIGDLASLPGLIAELEEE